MRTTATLLVALVFALPVASQQPPANNPAKTAQAKTEVIAETKAVVLPHSMILSNEDEHGCNYVFYWDATKSICSIRLHFPAGVTCKPADSKDDLVCSYKPKQAEKK